MLVFLWDKKTNAGYVGVFQKFLSFQRGSVRDVTGSGEPCMSKAVTSQSVGSELDNKEEKPSSYNNVQ